MTVPCREKPAVGDRPQNFWQGFCPLLALRSFAPRKCGAVLEKRGAKAGKAADSMPWQYSNHTKETARLESGNE